MRKASTAMNANIMKLVNKNSGTLGTATSGRVPMSKRIGAATSIK